MSEEDPRQLEETGRKTDALGRFAPGNKSGGRPAVSKVIREIAQQHGAEAIAGLLALARDEGQAGAVRRAAWVDVLDRAYGKPTVGEPDEAGQQGGGIHLTWGDGTS